MQKNLAYVDIGTHMGQEYKALFSYSIWQFIYRFLKVLLASYIIKNRNINKVGLREAITIIKNSRHIRKHRKNICTILVEPNNRLYGEEVYLDADKVFCLALGDMHDNMHFSNLYFPNDNKLSQGASIFKTKKDIDLSDGNTIIACGCVPFAEMLKQSLDELWGENNFEIVIRINCEGSEDSGIYAFQRIFKGQLNVIFGSLKDVGELKGSSKMDSLWDFIEAEDLKFVPFSPKYTTWRDATTEILEILENRS